MSRYFAVDLGAESGRCIAGTLESGKLKLDELCRFPTQGVRLRGKLKWNIYRFYEEILNGLKQYVKKYGNELDAIGVDTWGVDYVLLDENGFFMELPYTYRDTRTEGTMEDVKKHEELLYKKTGIQFLEFNTLNQLIADKKIENYQEKAKGILFIADALHYLLGARRVCEYSAASISMMVNTETKQWDDEIFEIFNLSKDMQTEIVHAGSQIGVLRDDIADEIGLMRGVPIITPAVHDTASAEVATPADSETFAFISSGTWSLAGTEISKPVKNQDSFKLNISNSGGVLGKSMFLKNIMGLWVIQNCKRQWNHVFPKLDYPEIVKQAEKATPFYGYIDVDDDDFFHPGNMPQRIVDFLEKTGQHSIDVNDVGTIGRMVYEGLALKYRYVFEKIEKAVGRKFTAVHVTGGGSRNEMLNQFIANAMNIKVTAGPNECTATGNLLMQAYGRGDVKNLNEIRNIVRNSFEINVYEPQDVEVWEKAYCKFKEYTK